MNSLVIIPARYASQRLPGKLLEEIEGRSIILRTWDQCRIANRPVEVVVATDDERIQEEVEKEGGRAVLTDPELGSGTERCAAALKELNDRPDVLINVQGDEPFIRPEQIDQLHDLLSDPEVGIGTLAAPIKDPENVADPNRVKVTFTQSGRCLYFSRAPIPYFRDEPKGIKEHHQHIGMYAYRAELLHKIAVLPPTPLEEAERLEQLRWMEHGHPVHVAISEAHPSGIDSPDDLERAKKRISEGKI